jgi:hypothetical protein
MIGPMTDHATADPTDNRPPVAATGTGHPTHDHGNPRPTGPADNTEATGNPRPTAPPDQEPTALRVGLPVALWVVSVVASWMSADGQLGTADWAGMEGPIRFGVPVILEGFMIVLLLLGYSQGRNRRSPYPLWALASLVGGSMVYLNLAHGGPKLGMLLGLASAAAIVAWFIKLRLELTRYLVNIGHMPPARPKLGKLFLVAPRVATRAWIIAVRRQVTTTAEATDLAEAWQLYYRDLRRLSQPRDISRRQAWREIYLRSGGRPAELPTTVQIDQIESIRSTTQTAETHQPTGDRPEPTTRPPDHPTTAAADRRPPTAGRLRPTDRPASRTDLRVVRPAGRSTGSAAANAAMLRELYPTGLPTNDQGAVVVRQIRDRMNWSYDRAVGAVKAYEARADLEEDERAMAVAA